MARLLPMPCTQPGCLELVRGGGRCHRHRNPRPIEGPRVYDTIRWKRLRVYMIAKEPLCRECAKKGVESLSEQIDHILPMSRGGDPWDEDNLQPLCGTCHSRKTKLENLPVW